MEAASLRLRSLHGLRRLINAGCGRPGAQPVGASRNGPTIRARRRTDS